MKQKPKNKKVMLIIYFFVILLPIIWFFFLNNGSEVDKASELLTGKWQRADGPYTLQITDVKENGALDIAYFNPNPIDGCKGSWRMLDDKLKVFVVLNHPSYQGSTYELTFNERSGNLAGLYYQAVAKQAFDVYFEKSN